MVLLVFVQRLSIVSGIFLGKPFENQVSSICRASEYHDGHIHFYFTFTKINKFGLFFRPILSQLHDFFYDPFGIDKLETFRKFFLILSRKENFYQFSSSLIFFAVNVIYKKNYSFSRVVFLFSSDQKCQLFSFKNK